MLGAIRTEIRPLGRQAPDAADGGLLGQRELRQREVRRQVLKDHADALADGDLGLGLGLSLGKVREATSDKALYVVYDLRVKAVQVELSTFVAKAPVVPSNFRAEHSLG